MNTLDFSILYVASVEAAADFYTRLLGRPPVELSPGFAMFTFGNGAALGLWRREAVTPAVGAPAGGSELAFLLPDVAAVEAIHQGWRAAGLTVAQPPMSLDFGYSAVVLDPDGHRIRVMVPGGGA